VDYPRQAHHGIRRYIPSFKQVVGLGALSFLALVAVVGVAYARTPIPSVNELTAAQTTVVYYSDGKSEIGRYGDQNRINVTLDQVPDHVQKAVLAAEDRSFYQNRGISPTGIARAFWNNVKGGSKQGGSTITQQYAKNAFLSQQRTYTRKAKEFFIAVKLDQRDDKNKILEDYLNTIYFGRNAYGIQTASQAYFHKDVGKLTVAEGAVLASVIRSPAGYDPVRYPDRLQSRFNYVLDGMVQSGWLPAAERAGLKVPKVAPRSTRAATGGPNYYLKEVVRRELKAHGFTDQQIDVGGLKVISTFDKRAQASAVKAVKEKRPTENAKGLHIGLSAVQPGTGAVVAMYGGDKAGGNNEVTQARVQPGSAFKPFALAAALDQGISLKSRFAGNSPFKLPDGKPVNNEFDKDYGQNVDLVRATTESINTAYVDLTMQIGPRKVLAAATALGVPETTPGLFPNARITLGTASVRNIDMASAYASFAAEGEAAQWHTVDEVRGANGGVRYKADVRKSRVVDKDVVADVSHALQQVVKAPGGTGRAARDLDRPAAGKTGTAEDKSAWFVGYTPQLAAAVDMYKGDGTQSLDGVGGLSTFFGGRYPTEIWTAFMQGALKGQEVKDFPPPTFVGQPVNPAPSPTPSPTTETPTATPTPSPSETKTQGPPSTPPGQTHSPGPPITIFPSDTSSPSTSPTDGGGGGGGGGGQPGGRARSTPTASPN
jgi:membrane peptidoglycan carboxypeptidase